MRGTTNLETWREAPAGGYMSGESWIHWCHSEELFGFLLWGRPGDAEIAQLVRSLKVELAPHVGPHRSLVDVRFLSGVDAGAFELLNQYVRDHYQELSKQVTKLALVRPDGFAGAAVAGFFEVRQVPYPVEIFSDLESAVEWLMGAPNLGLVQELGELRTAALGVDPLVQRLRVLIVENLQDLTVEAAASALRVSHRTLQRRLKEAGTTFKGEVTLVRIREAQRRMLDSDAALTAVALDVGFSSLQHFSRVFRQVTGAQPSAWRDKNR